MSNWSSRRVRLTLAAVILFSFVGCDQATKRIATDTLQNQPSMNFMGDTVRLEYALNPGGFLSVGSSLPPVFRTRLFIGVNVILLTCVAAFLVTGWRCSLLVYASLASILAGGVGNLIDRVTNDGLVIDFINLGIGPVRTGVFNVADVGVMIGSAALVFWSVRSHGSTTSEVDDST